jgi:hypothetical protein
MMDLGSPSFVNSLCSQGDEISIFIILMPLFHEKFAYFRLDENFISSYEPFLFFLAS